LTNRIHPASSYQEARRTIDAITIKEQVATDTARNPGPEHPRTVAAIGGSRADDSGPLPAPNWKSEQLPANSRSAVDPRRVDRRALDTNDDAELPIVAASGQLSKLRVNMPISA
jgi:hypothetical protein